MNAILFILKPQIVPKNVDELGTELYNVSPFTINILKASDRTYFLPILKKISVEERVAIFKAINAMRLYEWRNLKPPFSIDLSSVVEDRREMM
jgi:hypothetical protein